MTMPTVSVIIPVYNVAGYVESCIAAVAAQTQPPLEVLLVDDRGQDNSVALAERALRHHQLSWRTIVQPGNRGLGAARDLGLDQAAGELVWFLDSDRPRRPPVHGDDDPGAGQRAGPGSGLPHHAGHR